MGGADAPKRARARGRNARTGSGKAASPLEEFRDRPEVVGSLAEIGRIRKRGDPAMTLPSRPSPRGDAPSGRPLPLPRVRAVRRGRSRCGCFPRRSGSSRWSGTIGGTTTGSSKGSGPGRRTSTGWTAAIERPDPASRHQPEGVHGPSGVVDPGAFRWRDGEWRGIPLSSYILYELHVGTFTPEGTFDAVIPHLDYLAELGITARRADARGPVPREAELGLRRRLPLRGRRKATAGRRG